MTIQLSTITEHDYLLTVNGEPQPMDMNAPDWMYTYFKFAMPNKDVTIELLQKAADIPMENKEV